MHVKQTAAHDFFGDFFFAPHWYSSNFITFIMFLLSLRNMFTFPATETLVNFNLRIKLKIYF